MRRCGRRGILNACYGSRGRTPFDRRDCRAVVDVCWRSGADADLSMGTAARWPTVAPPPRLTAGCGGSSYGLKSTIRRGTGRAFLSTRMGQTRWPLPLYQRFSERIWPISQRSGSTASKPSCGRPSSRATDASGMSHLVSEHVNTWCVGRASALGNWYGSSIRLGSPPQGGRSGSPHRARRGGPLRLADDSRDWL